MYLSLSFNSSQLMTKLASLILDTFVSLSNPSLSFDAITSSLNIFLKDGDFFCTFNNMIILEISKTALFKFNFYFSNTGNIWYWSIAEEQCCDSFRWLSHTHIYIHSSPSPSSFQAGTQHWAEFIKYSIMLQFPHFFKIIFTLFLACFLN